MASNQGGVASGKKTLINAIKEAHYAMALCRIGQGMIAHSYEEYRQLVLEQVAVGQRIGIFSAAVADYRPRRVVAGKIASGQAVLPLELVPTEKVIDLVAAADPALRLVTFKVVEGVSEAELLNEARRRLQRSSLVVANRSEDVVGEQQTAWLLSRTEERRLTGKAAIATALCDQLETMLAAQDEPNDPEPQS